MARDTLNRSLDFNAKLKYFIACYLLVWLVLQDAIGKFITILNNRGVVNLGKNFNPSNLFWTDEPLWNIVKFAIICGLAFIFGVAYSHMARKIRASDKVTISMVNAIVGIFGYVIILFLIIAIFRNDALHESFVRMRDVIRQDNLYMAFIVFQFIGAGVLTFVGINTGQKLVGKFEEDDKGKLLGIKWYHYIWLSPAISIYIQSFLFLIYLTIPAIRTFFANFNWGDLLGGNTDSTHNNSVSSLIWSFAFLYLIAVVIFYLIKLQRDVLAGKTKMHTVFKVLISIAVSLIIPILLITFTAIGDNN